MTKSIICQYNIIPPIKKQASHTQLHKPHKTPKNQANPSNYQPLIHSLQIAGVFNYVMDGYISLTKNKAGI